MDSSVQLLQGTQMQSDGHEFVHGYLSENVTDVTDGVDGLNDTVY